MMDYDPEEIDEALGITRCARCGHRLQGEVECPFCAAVGHSRGLDALPKWIYITACFLTSPLSIYFVARSRRLSTGEKILAISGCLLWAALFFVL
jgi:hypothetical protein